MSDALTTLYAAMGDRLSDNFPWDKKVFSDVAPGGILRPVLVFNKVSGGDSNSFHQSTPGFLVDVKCIADGENSYSEAMDGAAAISNLLKDQGAQDIDDSGNPGVVVGDDNWLIKTITQQGRIHEVDDWTIVGEFIYHSGHEFLIEMEDIS